MRFENYNKSIFKSKKIFKIDNNSDKNYTFKFTKYNFKKY